MVNSEGARRREQRRGPVLRRHGQMQQGTTDQHLLDTRGTADWVHEDPFRVMRIQSEFVEGFGALARTPARDQRVRLRAHQRDSPEYEAAVAIGRGLVEAGFAVITGGGPGAMEAANKGGPWRPGASPSASASSCPSSRASTPM
ncbi:hypothetical protein GCM10020221_20860 [Streptomyces thioluteus]|uniref:Uncharacterized protein n=1 Tax=Streptomyces thioluteus TaxID=66431 RepID=A0ABN3WQZ0_STRTU